MTPCTRQAAAFVIDCVWNMQPVLIANNTVPLVRQLRQTHPTTPIVLAEDTECAQTTHAPPPPPPTYTHPVFF